MKSSNTFLINGTLSAAKAQELSAQGMQIGLDPTAAEAIQHCRSYLDNKLASGNAAVYGVNTGFGSLCNTVVAKDELSQLQVNLLRSHACGNGDTVPLEVVKLMLLLKVQSLAYGNSGVTLATVNRLIDFYNHDLFPVVYEQGSLGASGDLAPLAHLCLPLIGEGEFHLKVNGQWTRKPALEVLREKGWEPLQLQSKEGLALINGTQFMMAYGLYVNMQLPRLWYMTNLIAATSMEAFDCRPDPFHASIHRIRPHAGQTATAQLIREVLNGSSILASHKQHVQDPYSFRCVPQVHGASYDALTYFASVMQTEMQSVTDNPNVFPEEDLILSGGNFHGQPLALAFDFAAMALAELGNISERRTYQLISGLRGLPPFLTANPGLNSGFMIPQYTAASIVSQNKQLCSPASVDSIVSSNGQEDHVSMGANAAVKLLRVLKNVEAVLAIELMNAAQALEFRRPARSSDTIESLLSAYRMVVPKLEDDRYLHDDIQKSVAFFRQYPVSSSTLESF